MLRGVYSSDYKTLISKVGSTGNEENIKETEDYLSEIDSHRDGVLKVVRIIKGEITSGRVTFKGKTPSKFANFKSGVQRRLGIKNKSPTGRVLGPEESYQQISGEGPSDENTSDQEESKQGPPDENTSGQGPPGQGPSNQAGARPIPAIRWSKLIGPETRV
ncbi:hypothetical protein BASA83_005095 [Batrachochytrium salamandrivorans]|nr:hypothetical protein BASA83_005095 [Batrachochytrium salamandrivorans]